MPITDTQSSPPDGALLDGTYRKIAFRLVPLLMFLWVIAWLDRINIGFAKLEMNAALGFSEAAFGLGAGILYLGYVLFELPSNLLLQKIGARKTIARIGIGWGLMTVLTAFVTEPWQFYAVRFMLGVFEAGFYPGAIFYLSQCFPQHRRAKVFGIFMSSAAIAGIIGGPLTAGIMGGMAGLSGLEGYQWVFIVQGVPAMIGGLVAFWFLTDDVRQARWLSPAQRAALVLDLDADRAASGAAEGSFLSAVRDPKLWILVTAYFFIIFCNTVPAYFGPSLLGDLTGAGRGGIGVMFSGIALMAAVGMILSGIIVDRTGRAATVCVSILGASTICYALAALVLGASPTAAAALFGVGTGFVLSVLPSFWQLPNAVFAGTAAATAVALINSFGNIGGFVGPTVAGQLRQSGDGTETILWALCGAMVIAALIVLFVVGLISRGGARQVPTTVAADA